MLSFGDYPVNMKPRYGYGAPAHSELTAIFNRNRHRYRQVWEDLVAMHTFFASVPVQSRQDNGLQWHNDWMSGLDLMVLCFMLRKYQPRHYVEIGSGISTRFVRYAIDHYHLKTRIVSIDPTPRTPVDSLCDERIRKPVEDLDIKWFERLGKDDILFMDGSHRVLMNSDVTAVMLDVLPTLPGGTIVHFHDVFLPYDYPPIWVNRVYSEQYMLAVCILFGSSQWEILMPNHFVTQDPGFSSSLRALEQALPGVTCHGASFWLQKK